MRWLANKNRPAWADGENVGVADLKGALTAPTTKNFAAIVDSKRIGELLLAIDGYVGSRRPPVP